jgi:D-alanyl-lipoteichoic acid acyltransferase DltB (MBOAT superfamily)
MVFNSVHFAFFFVVAAALLAATPARHRWIPLLAASYYFYMCWRVEHVLVLMGATLVTYLSARAMSTCAHPGAKKMILGLCLSVNIGSLFFFKYFNFFSRSLNEALRAWNIFTDLPIMEIVLPIGISFYLFQSTGYAVDVYRGRAQPERHLGFFALFVAFWPQILAGPIGRAEQLLPQFMQAHGFDYQRVVRGLRLMLWGLLKKVVIADHLAVYVGQVYGHLETHRGFPLIFAAVFYTVQIYCDFSGYTDMARGAARIMGYELMENFSRPYFAKSMREFWQRWHISLSTWFRDYVYIPLGGRRVATWRWYTNLMITFTLSGLWHGANWTFVIWGAIHGGCLVLEYSTGGFQQRLADKLFRNKNSGGHKTVQAGITLSLVCLAWVFFRSESAAAAFYWIGHMVLLDPNQMGVSIVGASSFMLSILLILILLLVDLNERQTRLFVYLERWPLALRWSVYTLATWAVALATIFGVRQEFIYFQF